MKIVECLPNGYPLDETYLNYPRFFNGSELIVFENLAEYDKYIKENFEDNSIIDEGKS